MIEDVSFLFGVEGFCLCAREDWGGGGKDVIFFFIQNEVNDPLENAEIGLPPLLVFFI